jgi:hypothetical protein
MAIGCHWGEFAMLLSPLFYRYYCTWELHAFPRSIGNACICGTLDEKVLWSHGTRGKGTFRMYPSGRFPTNLDVPAILATSLLPQDTPVVTISYQLS